MIDQPDMFGHYHCVSLDPPWLERGGGKSVRGAQRHYPLMKTDDIIDTVCQAEEFGRIHRNAHCWMWVTDNFLEDGLRLMKAMGFRYVRTLVWVKVKRPNALLGWLQGFARSVLASGALPELLAELLAIGLGQYLSGAHELALFGVRGDAMVPRPADRMPSVVFAPRGRHSEKPDAAVEVFERVSPGPRLEMFARTARAHWTAWGSEINDG